MENWNLKLDDRSKKDRSSIKRERDRTNGNAGRRRGQKEEEGDKRSTQGKSGGTGRQDLLSDYPLHSYNDEYDYDYDEDDKMTRVLLSPSVAKEQEKQGRGCRTGTGGQRDNRTPTRVHELLSSSLLPSRKAAATWSKKRKP